MSWKPLTVTVQSEASVMWPRTRRELTKKEAPVQKSKPSTVTQICSYKFGSQMASGEHCIWSDKSKTELLSPNDNRYVWIEQYSLV